MMLMIMTLIGIPASGWAAAANDFVVVLDAGHGGKDHGAIDNGVREKDINLAVTLRLGELIKKKLKNTKVVYTRDDDTFVSLQGRAEIANKSKGNLFISIHTNSVDAKNKNRRTVAGASVYTQGGHKDDANLEVAKRENSVIELENGYEQKYSGFDPNKVESYIIFEMATKHNLAQSHRFAKNVQENLIKVAQRKDRGVHQAGFWVLWATSMPSALVELDFICNPESAKFLDSKQGVDKLAEAIFNAVKTYEEDFRKQQKMIASSGYQPSGEVDMRYDDDGFADAVHAGVGTSREISENDREEAVYAAVSNAPAPEQKDLSHTNLEATRSQTRARNAADGRRRRSSSSATASAARNLAVNHIEVKQEYSADLALLEPDEEPESKVEEKDTPIDTKNKKKDKKASKSKAAKSEKSTKNWVAEVNKNAQTKASKKKDSKISSEFVAAKSQSSKNSGKGNSGNSSTGKSVSAKSSTSSASGKHAGERKSIRRRN